MKLNVMFIFFFLCSITYSQNYLGFWKGEILENQTVIPVEFNIMVQNDTMIGAFMNKPKFCSFNDFSFHRSGFHLKSEKEKLTYTGDLTENKNQLKGEFTINGKTYQLDLFRGNGPMYTPQEPKKPFPYYSEEISFVNDSVTIAGTLTIPDTTGKFPAVILLSGSSPSNRDYESLYHKYFLVLADHLTRNGIAVLRCDSRGVNKSSGDFYQSTVVDLAKDAMAGFNYLTNRSEILGNSIGLLGHSEGGVVATISASMNINLRFMILLASPGRLNKADYILQTDLKYKHGDLSKEGYDYNMKFIDVCYNANEFGMDKATIIDTLVLFHKRYTAIYPNKNGFKLVNIYNNLYRGLMNPHNMFSMKINVQEYMEKVKCPVLSIGGTNDILVPANIHQEFIRTALLKGRNDDYKILTLEGLNHNLQECKTGSLEESLSIQQTISPLVLKEITDWIKDHTK